jgi:hypothetical protein
MKRGPHEHIWLLALAGALAACGGGGGGPGTGSAMLGGQQSVAAQSAAGTNGAAMPAPTIQPMPAQNPDAMTLMQMGDVP